MFGMINLIFSFKPFYQIEAQNDMNRSYMSLNSPKIDLENLKLQTITYSLSINPSVKKLAKFNNKFDQYLEKDSIISSEFLKYYKRKEFTNSNSIHLANSIFCYCSSPLSGGAVYIHGIRTYVSLQRMIFLRCISKFYQSINEREFASGGAVFCYSKTTHISYTCFDSCNSKFIGLAFYSQIQNEQDHVVNYSSVSLSFSTVGKFAFCMEGGISHVDNLNSTKNKAESTSGGGFGSYPIPQNGFIKYSQFERNSGKKIFMLQLENDKNHQINSCNFINNTLLHSSLAILCCSSGLILKKFYFVANEGNLIYTLSYISLVSCVTDQESFGLSPNCKLQNCKVKKLDTEPLKLKFMQVC